MSGNWLIDTLIATSLLMVLVLLIRRPIARHFGPRLAYALWLIPVARLFMPSLSVEQMPEAASAANGAVTVVVRDAVMSAAPQEAGIASALPSVATVALVLWLLGAVMLFTVQMTRYLRARRAMMRDAAPVAQAGRVEIIATPHVGGPLAFGLIQPFVAVPMDFAERFSASERELALAHELAHHRAGDLYANMAGFVLLCLQWFNPLAWMSWAAFRLDQEAACDARVLAGRSAEDRHLYGTTLARTASGGIPAFATALNSPKTIIERLRRMTMKETSKGRVLAGKIALAVAVVVALPLTATIVPVAAQDDGAAAEPRIEKREVRIIKHGDGPADGQNVVKIQRGDRTYVFHSNAPMSREEIEAKIAEADAAAGKAQAEAGVAEAEADRAVAEAEKSAADADKQVRHVMVVRKHGDGGTWTDKDGKEYEYNSSDYAANIPEISVKELDGDCTSNETVSNESASENGKQVRRVKIVVCGRGKGQVARSSAIASLKEARAEVAADADIPDKIKADLLAGFDARISKLEAEGGQ